jgi:hypothetical protein
MTTMNLPSVSLRDQPQPDSVPGSVPDSAPGRDARQRDLLPPQRLAASRATVVGVGAVGRQVALQLAAMGVGWLQLVDFDTVETVNLGPQGYFESDVGLSKVSATAELCRRMNQDIQIHPHPERFRRSLAIGNVLFCCVDSIQTRSILWQAAKDRVELWVDGRMNAEVLRVLSAADPESRRHYPATLFDPAEAHQGACTARSTIYTASICAGLMLQQFSRYLRRLPIEKDSTLNLLAAELTAG